MTALWAGPLIAIIIIAILETKLYPFKSFYVIAGVAFALVIGGSVYLAFFITPKAKGPASVSRVEIAIPNAPESAPPPLDAPAPMSPASEIRSFLNRWASELAKAAASPGEAETLFTLYCPDVQRLSVSGPISPQKFTTTLAGLPGMGIHVSGIDIDMDAEPTPTAAFTLSLIKADATVTQAVTLAVKHTDTGLQIARESGVWDALKALDEMTRQPPAPVAALSPPPNIPEALPETEEQKTVKTATDSPPVPWTVQMASYRKWEVAKHTATALLSKGEPIYTTPVEVPGKGIWYRMFYGRYPDKTAADAALAAVKKSGAATAITTRKPLFLNIVTSEAPDARDRLVTKLIALGAFPMMSDDASACRVGAYRHPEEARGMVKRLSDAGIAYTLVKP